MKMDLITPPNTEDGTVPTVLSLFPCVSHPSLSFMTLPLPRVVKPPQVCAVSHSRLRLPEGNPQGPRHGSLRNPGHLRIPSSHHGAPCVERCKM